MLKGGSPMASLSGSGTSGTGFTPPQASLNAAGRQAVAGEARPRRAPLYTPEQRVRRDTTRWTLVQGILAPVQFLVFLLSLGLVIRYLLTHEGYAEANVSVVVKTMVLYTIMVTGAIWEKVVFGRYLFAPAFYWEDVFSMLVIALHTAYLVTLFIPGISPTTQMLIALAAYATYVVNAIQFVLKLRAARLDEAAMKAEAGLVPEGAR